MPLALLFTLPEMLIQLLAAVVDLRRSIFGH
jgi:hypothetical protein